MGREDEVDDQDRNGEKVWPEVDPPEKELFEEMFHAWLGVGLVSPATRCVFHVSGGGVPDRQRSCLARSTAGQSLGSAPRRIPFIAVASGSRVL